MIHWQNDEWKRKMRVRLDFNLMMESRIGEGYGITEDDIEELCNEIDRVDADIKKQKKEGKIGFMELPYQDEKILDKIETIAKRIRSDYENFVIIGIGGSSLGSIALHNALNHSFHNLLSNEKRNAPKMFFPDNIDPELLANLFDVIDVKKTMFNVITKSGSTSETMANFLIVWEKLQEELGDDAAKSLVVTTDPVHGNLHRLSGEYGFDILEVPTNVGGRFSVLSPVGLLSAAVSGIDIRELLAGAAYMDDICQISDVWQNPAYMHGVLQYIMYNKGKTISVMMPYSNALYGMADWYRQLWAESLGKKYSLEGEEIYVGPTPIKALGATDQHSQIQLYMEGPYDKIITFLLVENFREEMILPETAYGLEGLDYFNKQSLNKLIEVEASATQIALADHNRPNCALKISAINPFTIGQLIYMLELETIFVGGLFNIDPFNQPGVESGKLATYALMGRRSYEDKRKDIETKQNQMSEKLIV